MSFTLTRLSSLEKIFPNEKYIDDCLESVTLLKGQSYSYQIAISSDDKLKAELSVISPLKDYIKLYEVKNVYADFPAYSNGDNDDDYITKEPALIPDALIPIDTENAYIKVANETVSVWVNIKIPQEIKSGEYPINISFTSNDEVAEKSFSVKVIDALLPEQKTLFTQWFHVDCIADIHNVEIYSEEHWSLIEKYMLLASELGINTILTPVLTPPLDTAEGTKRPCTQLVKIEKSAEKYIFDFSLLKRWIDLTKKCGIKNLEISHLFTQWGLKFTPNIKVIENGEESYKFGWHVDSKSEEYKNFLSQLLPALIEFLKDEGVKENCFFHLSDEPNLNHLENYEYAYSLVKQMIDGCPIIDAISNYEFFEKGLMDIPVTASDHIAPFLYKNKSRQWVYYCCVQQKHVGNRFMAMPSYRNRILGLQIYKYGIEGFLQWGYNFYYSQFSLKLINPFITSSSDKAFPSGDPFSVYPVKDGAVPSLRALIFKEALEDIEICRLLESYIGKEKVIELIDKEAQTEITFDNYPRNHTYIPSLMEKMKQMIASFQ